MLAQSRLVLKRITHLGVAAVVTRDSRFIRRAEQEMLTAAAFPTWNPPHFLDVGEMAAALALGYDWLHDDLAPATRATVREALVEKALLPGLRIDAANWWHTDSNNWNQVCFGGLILAALAIRDETPALADEVLTFAQARLTHGLAPYAPHGVYPEGPSYWVFGTSYSVLTASALRTALGTDGGIPSAPGFLASCDFVNAVLGPAGEWFSYGDCRSSEGERAALFWFAAETRRPALAAREEASLLRLIRQTPPDPAGSARRFLPLALLWRETTSDAPVFSPAHAQRPLPLHWRGDGPAPVAVHRGAWSEDAAYIAIKGGSGTVSHGHLDAGSFVYDVHGLRWALDPGMENYGPIEARGLRLWSPAQDSDRWRIFRLGNFGHNTPSLGGELHLAKGFAPIVAFSADPARAFTVLDLTALFQNPPSSAHRGVRLFPDGQLLVVDAFHGVTAARPPVWQMLTPALVEPLPDGALLHREGKTIRLRLLASAPVELAVIPAYTLLADFDSPLPGVSVLRFTAPITADASLYGVLLQPVPDAAPAATFATLADPASWTTPSA